MQSAVFNYLFFSKESKPAHEKSKEVLTPRSQCGSICDGSVDDDITRTSESETRQLSTSESSSGSLSPRRQISGVSASDDIKTFVEGANSGDGFDPRWLETGHAELTTSSLSGDGTLANVGRNVSGTHCCTMCKQQFACEQALNLHTKFMHQEDEQLREWLPFPSAFPMQHLQSER